MRKTRKLYICFPPPIVAGGKLEEGQNAECDNCEDTVANMHHGGIHPG